MPKRLPCTASTRYSMISGFMTIDAEPERAPLLEITRSVQCDDVRY